MTERGVSENPPSYIHPCSPRSQADMNMWDQDPSTRAREAAFEVHQTQRDQHNQLNMVPHPTQSGGPDPSLPQWLVDRLEELQELKRNVERQQRELKERSIARVALVMPYVDEYLLRLLLGQLERELQALPKVYLVEQAMAKGDQGPTDWEETLRESSDKFFAARKKEIEDWDDKWQPLPWEETLPTLPIHEPSEVNGVEEFEVNNEAADPEVLQNDDTAVLAATYSEPEDVVDLDDEYNDYNNDHAHDYDQDFDEIPVDELEDIDDLEGDAGFGDPEGYEEREELFEPLGAANTLMTGTEYEQLQQQIAQEDSEGSVEVISDDEMAEIDEYEDGELEEEVEYDESQEDEEDDGDNVEQETPKAPQEPEVFDIDEESNDEDVPMEDVKDDGSPIEALEVHELDDPVGLNIDGQQELAAAALEALSGYDSLIQTGSETTVEDPQRTQPDVNIAPQEDVAAPKSPIELVDHHDTPEEPVEADDEEEEAKETDQPEKTETGYKPVRVDFGFDITTEFESESENIDTPYPQDEDDSMNVPESVQHPVAVENTEISTQNGDETVKEIPQAKDVHLNSFDVSFNVVPNFDEDIPAPIPSPAKPDDDQLKQLETTAPLVRYASRLFGKSSLFGGKAPVRIEHSTPAPSNPKVDIQRLSSSAKKVFDRSPLFGGKTPIRQPVFDSITTAKFKRDESFDAKFVHPVVEDNSSEKEGAFSELKGQSKENSAQRRLESLFDEPSSVKEPEQVEDVIKLPKRSDKRSKPAAEKDVSESKTVESSSSVKPQRPSSRARASKASEPAKSGVTPALDDVPRRNLRSRSPAKMESLAELARLKPPPRSPSKRATSRGEPKAEAEEPKAEIRETRKASARSRAKDAKEESVKLPKKGSPTKQPKKETPKEPQVDASPSKPKAPRGTVKKGKSDKLQDAPKLTPADQPKSPIKRKIDKNETNSPSKKAKKGNASTKKADTQPRRSRRLKKEQ